MDKFFKNKKTIVIFSLSVLIVIALIFTLTFKTHNSNQAKNAYKQDNKSASDANKNDNIQNNDNKKENYSQKSNEKSEKTDEKVPRNEDKNVPDTKDLEEKINKFNSLPEGEEKEKLRSELQEIFDYADSKSPAKSN